MGWLTCVLRKYDTLAILFHWCFLTELPTYCYFDTLFFNPLLKNKAYSKNYLIQSATHDSKALWPEHDGIHFKKQDSSFWFNLNSRKYSSIKNFWCSTESSFRRCFLLSTGFIPLLSMRHFHIFLNPDLRVEFERSGEHFIYDNKEKYQ